ncbi:MAG: glycosyltransferase family 4 protein [Ignavibacteriaceae bacterium]|jgi:glycosyltransferase involved in cell wall biosynthesis|nr:glycosyltransferase family 4 protein [Ignavibacteriaceae bacterium]
MNILNILYFSPEVGGGIVKHLFALGRVSKSKGYNLVFGFTKTREWQVELQANSEVLIIPEIENPFRSGFRKKLQKICESHSTDIVHFHFLFAMPFSLSLSFRKWGLPVIYHWHNPPNVLNEFTRPKNLLPVKLMRYYSGLIARLTDKRVITKHISISKEISELLIKNKWTSPEKIIFLQNGILLNDSSQIIQKVKTNKLPIIGMVANFRTQKDHKTLLTALNILIKSGYKAELWLAGDGPTRAEMQKLATDLQIESNVRFLGMISNLTEIYRRIDVFVLSTHYEGHPLAILEAMSFGLPVIATRVSSIQEVIEEGKNGLLVNPGDPNDLALALKKILTNDLLFSQLSEASLKTTREQQSVDDWARNLISLYENVLAGLTH